MQLFRQLSTVPPTPRAVAIGNFDGLHLGHRSVIEAMLAAADAQNLVPSVLTFAPHPRRFFNASAPDFCIDRLRDKLARLRAWGVQQVIMPRFDQAFATIRATEFLERILGDTLRTQVVVTGENFTFGHQRGGNSAVLQEWGRAQEVRILTMPPLMLAGQVCSSSAVRRLIAAGEMEGVASLLGRPYTLSGVVQHGKQLGRTLGFPTANIAPCPGLLVPAYGVYAVRVVVDGVLQAGVANIGMRPTIGGAAQPLLEVHLFDFAQDLYGKRLEVALLAKLRDEMTFAGLDMLKAQIAKDCIAAQLALSGAV